MPPIRFAIIGAAGWRAQFFLRAVAAAPERFAVTGLLVRNPEKAAEQQKLWGINTYPDLDSLLATDPQFCVVSVTRGTAHLTLKELTRRNMPALCETPPAEEVPGLIELHELVQRGAKIQVAEQFIFQPMHAARLALVRSGKLGAVTQVQISAGHGYHGMSLMRHLLGVRFENARIRGLRFTSPIVAAGGRGGPPDCESIRDCVQNLAWLEFDGSDGCPQKLGVFDFTGDQYFSPIRSPRLLIRGERGEINNTRLRYLKDFRTPIEQNLIRSDAGHLGNLEGHHLKGILAGDEWIYRNPLAPARLSDEEIAVGTSLLKMGDYVQGGPDFYPLSAAAQDRYLDLMITQSIESGQVVQTQTQPWAQG